MIYLCYAGCCEIVWAVVAIIIIWWNHSTHRLDPPDDD